MTSTRQDARILPVARVARPCCGRLLRFSLLQVGYSALLFYGYVGIIGFALFAALKWGFKGQTSLVQTWCAYGEDAPQADATP